MERARGRQADQRERLVKISRDITATSKKAIFAMHRWRGLYAPRPRLRSPVLILSVPCVPRVKGQGHGGDAAALAEAQQRLGEIRALFRTAAPDVRGPDMHRYALRLPSPLIHIHTPTDSRTRRGYAHMPCAGATDSAPWCRFARNVTGGLQEYIEAVTFAHYLQTGTVLSLDAVNAGLCDDDGAPVCIGPLPLSLSLTHAHKGSCVYTHTHKGNSVYTHTHRLSLSL
jgi:hypothetical protein